MAFALGAEGGRGVQFLGLAQLDDSAPGIGRESARLNPSARGPACDALGLIGDPKPRVLAALEGALGDDSDQVVDDAAIAQGFIGRPAIARRLGAKWPPPLD